MDLQIKLINDGYAQSYVSTQKSALPSWAVWKNQGYGVTAEPVVFVYDSRRPRPDQVPHSHAELRSLLEAGTIPGPVATYDPKRSGLVFSTIRRIAWPGLTPWRSSTRLGRRDPGSTPRPRRCSETFSPGR